MNPSNSQQRGFLHPVLRELGLTRDIIRKYVVPAPRQAAPEPAVTAQCPRRLGTRALREFRKANGLNTATGMPLVRRKHPELKGLKGNQYNKEFLALLSRPTN